MVVVTPSRHTAPMPVELSDAISPAAATMRTQLLAVRRWALAAKSELRGEPVTRWRRLDVYQHLWADVRNWCSSYLDETDGFAEGSDPIRELRKPLRCYGGLGPDGLQAKPGAPQPRCVCKVPYRRRG